jgi:predicted PurR-regulated permease PerM
MLTSDDSRTLAQIALVVLLIIGCIAVLLPFVGALLFALVVWLCTWEAYRDHILPRLGGKPILGAALMVLALMLVFLVPTIFLAGALVRSSDVLVNHVRPLLTQGLPADPPAWFASVPLFGDMLDNFWHEIAGSREAFNALLGRGIGPVREFLLRAGGRGAGRPRRGPCRGGAG